MSLEGGINRQDAGVLEKPVEKTIDKGEAAHEENVNNLLHEANDRYSKVQENAQMHQEVLSPATKEKLSLFQRMGISKTPEQKAASDLKKTEEAKAKFKDFLGNLKFELTQDQELAKQKITKIADIVANESVLAQYASQYEDDKSAVTYLRDIRKGLSEISDTPSLLNEALDFAQDDKDRLIKFLIKTGWSGKGAVTWDPEKKEYKTKGTNVSGNFIASR